MSKLQKTLKNPDNTDIENWFTNIAQHLLNNSDLLVNNKPHRIVEIEFYYFINTHQDYFSHCDPLHLEYARWYFHKIGGTYKGGTFKGLDLTFGASDIYGGILIRSIEMPDGKLICGPSLCVDYLLTQTNTKSIAELDEQIAGRTAFDDNNILRLETSPPRQHELFTTARVGLSLKKATALNNMHLFISRPYRYLTEPRRITKGKVHLVLALYARGMNTEEISKITGSPRRSIEQYINEFEIGQKKQDYST